MSNPFNAPVALKAIRTRLELTQEQLAERLGVSFATVNRWEGGANAPKKGARAAIVALAEEAGIDTVDPEAGVEVPVKRSIIFSYASNSSLVAK